jgi:hypothetical protein
MWPLRDSVLKQSHVAFEVMIQEPAKFRIRISSAEGFLSAAKARKYRCITSASNAVARSARESS